MGHKYGGWNESNLITVVEGVAEQTTMSISGSDKSARSSSCIPLFITFHWSHTSYACISYKIQAHLSKAFKVSVRLQYSRNKVEGRKDMTQDIEGKSLPHENYTETERIQRRDGIAEESVDTLGCERDTKHSPERKKTTATNCPAE
jgi:hypothetical protein